MMERWSPRWAPLVEGTYERDEDGGPGGTPIWRYEVTCSKCGERFKGVCATGEVRARISDFARQHVHRDAFKSEKG